MTSAGTRAPTDARGGPIERFLRFFTDVRSGEATTALLLTVNIFVIMTAYYIIKTLREPLILGVPGGAEAKSYSAAGQAALLSILVPLYGALAGKLPRRPLINAVTLFFVLCIAVFFLLVRANAPVGVAFFLWVGIFNLMIIAQFWSFANDVYTNDEGKRLFPILVFGMSAGSVCGTYVIKQVIEPLGVATPLLISAALLIIGLVFTNLIDARERRRTELRRLGADTTRTMPAATREIRLDSGEFKIADLEEASRAGAKGGDRASPIGAPGGTATDVDAGRPLGRSGAFGLVFGNRYLLFIALLMLLLNWVNTTGEYILDRTVTRAAQEAIASGTAGGLTEKQWIGLFKADYFFVVNIAGLVLQLFVVSRVIKFFGVRVALAILPAIALLGYGFLAFYPVLEIVRWVKTAENSTDYSLHNTVRNILFLPTTREEKYKAKQAIDSFFWRAGDMLQAGLVFAGTTWLAFNTQSFAMVNLGLVAVWLVLAVLIGRAYARKSAATAVAASSGAGRG